MRSWAIRGLPLIILLVLYAPTLADLVAAWWTDSYGGHGMFVPLFSAIVLWSDRERLRRAVGAMTAAGLPLLVGGLVLLAAATRQESLFLAGLSFPVSLAGLIWCLLGRDLLRAAFFPVGFLALWVPLPRSVVVLVTEDLQALVAKMVGGLVGALGVPVHQHGKYLDLSTTTLEVIEGCNGLRFMMALLVLAVALAHASQRGWPTRALLALSAIPLAMGANVVRIAVVAVACHLTGPQAAQGLAHHSMGKTVWALTLLTLLALAYFLRRLTTPDAPDGGQPA